MATEFKLPELAEGIDTVTVTGILVAVGDTVTVDQPVLEIETDKAATEVPSSISGTVTEIRVEEGQKVAVGDVMFVASENGQETAPTPKVEEPAMAPAPEPEPEPVDEAPEQEAVSEADNPVKAAKAAPTPPPAPKKPAAAGKAATPPPAGIVPAAPSVRRLARELGVKIQEVVGTGSDGRITEDDVRTHAGATAVETPAEEAHTLHEAPETPPTPQPVKKETVKRTPSGDVDIHDMSKVRAGTAENLSNAWATIPHVTQFDKADITHVEKLRKKYGARVEKSGGKLTVTAIIAKLLAGALQKFPQFNASVDMESKQIIYKNYYNIGIAVDTDRGLLVPVLKDVDKKNITEICAELQDLAVRTRSGSIKLEEVTGATFTISNLGGIGGTAFTPIINPPEVAILGVSRGRVEPVWNGNDFEPRTMLPLSLSYDHRIIDGADAARFARWLAEALEQPFLTLLEG
jgi:pyruvate dehydrogenase E2 component (dihydrolipoamide acetyltransferase)